MTDRAWLRLGLAALAVLLIGAVLCIVGGILDPTEFVRAWLGAFLLWLGVPLAGVTLVLVHDLTGGRWMATARPVLNAAIVTMPLATLAGIPAFVGLHGLYSWTHPAPSLTNTFYLNSTAFYLRYAIDVVLWNLLAAYALFAPRGEAQPITSGLSWLSGVGLVVLAFSAGFASIDWIMSLEPTFWSSVFPMIAGAGWFNTGLALVVLTVAVAAPAPDSSRLDDHRDHLSDLAMILLATTIFWAYVEFCQFLIIWEENLKDEIPWYLLRLVGVWRPVLLIGAVLGFFVPFFGLLTGPGKRSRGVVAAVCGLVLLGNLADKWWLVLPEFQRAGPFWLDVGAVLALGALVLLLFLWWLRNGAAYVLGPPQGWTVHHG